MKLTKSEYLNYLQCPRETWLMRQKPELFKREKDVAAEYLKAMGYRIQKHAESLFAGDGYEFEKRFETENLLARSDIYSNGAIYEVKSSGSLKEEHIDDLAFQKAAAEMCGFPVNKTFLIHLNKEYIRNGEIAARDLLTIEDVTETVNKRMPFTRGKIDEALAYLQVEPPEKDIAGYCKRDKLDCLFIRHYHPDLPEYTIFDISNFRGKGFDALLDSGVLDIMDVPEDYPLTERQRKQVDIAQAGVPHILADEIKEQIGALQYPIYFLDYETANPGIPVYDGHRPFEVITFQFSVHVMEDEGGELKHYEFLADGNKEPTRELVEAMREIITDEGGTVIVWSAYEKTRNNDMATRCADLAGYLDSVNQRSFDLMGIFSKGLYVDPKFKGSPSIKTVLPVMLPHLSYEHLQIKQGSTASAVWLEMLSVDKTDEEKESMRNGMLAYCEMDTLAMVEILNVLRREFCR